MTDDMKCSTCGKRIETEKDWVRFSCPKCGKETIIRCGKCKRIENHYTCSQCNFSGP